MSAPPEADAAQAAEPITATEVEVTPAKAPPPASGGGGGGGPEEPQRRSLNVNAKSFTPKLDDPRKPPSPAAQPIQQQQQHTPARAASGTAASPAVVPGSATKAKTGSGGGGGGATPGKQTRSPAPPSRPHMPLPSGPGLGTIPGLAPNLLGMPFFAPGMALPPHLMMAAAAAAAAATSPSAHHAAAAAPRFPGVTPPALPPGLMSLMPGGLPPPSTAAAVAALHAAMNAGKSAAVSPAAAAVPTAVPPTPGGSKSAAGNGTGTGTGSGNVTVNVGNATLNALKNHVPPKFACVLIVGAPGVGKTTIGRQLVQELNEDQLGWTFFSGSDYISAKKLPHETLRDVYDALDKRLDECVARQKSATPIRGMIIDKNCRGIEEVHYLSALLQSKGLTLTAVVNFDLQDDAVLLARLGQGEDFREKIKHHRVILSRIQEAAKLAGLWKSINAEGERKKVLQALRTMVLGCSAQPPSKQLNPASYGDSVNPIVADYRTYCDVLSTLFTLVKTAKPGQFPLSAAFAPLKESHLVGRRAVIRDASYAVRRRVDGSRYALVFDGAGLYLVPRHMRAILHVPREAWLGIPLSKAGKFVLDGDLVRLIKERHHEKFVVNDALFWGDKDSGANLLARAGWEERQERLKVNLCGESVAFFPKKCDCVVVHQVCEPLTNALSLLEPCDYGSDGLIFVPKQPRDPTIVWRPPEAVTVDFRIGPCETLEGGVRRFPVEVFDQRAAKYAQFRSDFIEITNPRQALVEGSIAVCALDTADSAAPSAPGNAAEEQQQQQQQPPPPQSSGRRPAWYFQRTRSDMPTAAMKAAVDELLAECLLPRATLERLLVQEKLVDAPPAAAAAAGGGGIGGAIGVGGMNAAPGPTPARLGFGSALGGTDPRGGSPQQPPPRDRAGAPARAERTPAAPVTGTPAGARHDPADVLAVFQSVVRGTVRAEPAIAAKQSQPPPQQTSPVAATQAGPRPPRRSAAPAATLASASATGGLPRHDAPARSGGPADGRVPRAAAAPRATAATRKERPAPSSGKDRDGVPQPQRPAAAAAAAAAPPTDASSVATTTTTTATALTLPNDANAAPNEGAKGSSSGDEGDAAGSATAGADKPKRRRRGARGGANRAGKRKAAAEGGDKGDGNGSAPDATPITTAVAA